MNSRSCVFCSVCARCGLVLLLLLLLGSRQSSTQHRYSFVFAWAIWSERMPNVSTLVVSAVVVPNELCESGNYFHVSGERTVCGRSPLSRHEMGWDGRAAEGEDPWTLQAEAVFRHKLHGEWYIYIVCTRLTFHFWCKSPGHLLVSRIFQLFHRHRRTVARFFFSPGEVGNN